jgi:tetratricopeptide (TPR) repeat protein
MSISKLKAVAVFVAAFLVFQFSNNAGFAGEDQTAEPKDTRADNSGSIDYARRGDFDKVIADFTDATRLDPQDADAYFNRANAYGMKGEFDKTREG